MRHHRLAAAVLLCALAACGGSAPPPPAPAAPQEAVDRVGDVTVRASTMLTSTLAPQVASQYGIPHDDRTVMLLVAARRGPDGQDVAVPARIEATVTNLQGQRQAVAMRELRSGELLDYVGTIEVALPDTLRFDIKVVLEGGATSTLQFTREFYPM